MEAAYIGDQSSESVNEMVTAVLPLAERLRTTGQAVNLLVDLSRLTKSTTESRRASGDALRQVPYDKIGLIGAQGYIRGLAKLVIRAARKSNKVRVFNTRTEAVAWLQSGR